MQPVNVVTPRPASPASTPMSRVRYMPLQSVAEVSARSPQAHSPPTSNSRPLGSWKAGPPPGCLSWIRVRLIARAANAEATAIAANSVSTGTPSAAVWVLIRAPKNAPMLHIAWSRDMIGPAPAFSTAMPFVFIETSMVPWATPKKKSPTTRLLKSQAEAINGSERPQPRVAKRGDDVRAELAAEPPAHRHRQNGADGRTEQGKTQAGFVEMCLGGDHGNPGDPGPDDDSVGQEDRSRGREMDAEGSQAHQRPCRARARQPPNTRRASVRRITSREPRRVTNCAIVPMNGGPMRPPP